MRKDITISAEPRDTRGKNEARRLRVRGLVPAVVYGMGTDPVAIAISPKEVTGVLKSSSGHNTIFDIDIQGSKAPVMITDWQHEPLKARLLHVDLIRIDLSKKVVVKVPVHTHGDPVGVKVQGGLHEVVTRDIEVECLPDDIPEAFTVEVAGLSIGQSIRASEIPMTGSMRLISPADAVISHVVGLKAVEEVTPEAAAAPEPEVVKKGKKEEAAPADKKDDKKKK
ncbi:MAG TPA: 50S ribosomal protein L25 [Bryobacteraceae bacterium]|nr:50S ribosomal protein L25 [Bryobacteraceae bacterium]